MSYKTTNKHRGWKLVETGHRYYHAYKGGRRVAVGGLRHGDREELTNRFIAIVEELEGRTVANAACQR